MARGRRAEHRVDVVQIRRLEGVLLEGDKEAVVVGCLGRLDEDDLQAGAEARVAVKLRGRGGP